MCVHVYEGPKSVKTGLQVERRECRRITPSRRSRFDSCNLNLFETAELDMTADWREELVAHLREPSAYLNIARTRYSYRPRHAAREKEQGLTSEDQASSSTRMFEHSVYAGQRRLPAAHGS